MTNKEKLEKLKKLADAMYYAAQYLTTDASRLHKAMDEYHQFITHEYHKEEPTIPDIIDEHWWEMLDEEPVSEDLGKVGSLKSHEYYPEKKTTNKTSKGVFDANMPRRKAYLRGFKDGAHAHKELIANKSVSEDLESVAEKYGKDTFVNECMENGVCDGNDLSDAFKAGANWQLNQIRKENE